MKNRNVVKVGLLLVGLATSIGFTQQTKAVEPDLKLDILKEMQLNQNNSNNILSKYDILNNTLKTSTSKSVDNVSVVEVPDTDITITFTPNEPEYTGAISDDPNNEKQDVTQQQLREGYVKNREGYNFSYNVQLNSIEEYSAVDLTLVIGVKSDDNQYVFNDIGFDVEKVEFKDRNINILGGTYDASKQQIVTNTSTNTLPTSPSSTNTSGIAIPVLTTSYFKGGDSVKLEAFVYIASATKTSGEEIEVKQYIPIITGLENLENPNAELKSYATDTFGKNIDLDISSNSIENNGAADYNNTFKVIPYRTLMGYGENAPTDIANKVVVIGCSYIRFSQKNNYYIDYDLETSVKQTIYNLNTEDEIEEGAIQLLALLDPKSNSFDNMTFRYLNNQYTKDSFDLNMFKSTFFDENEPPIPGGNSTTIESFNPSTGTIDLKTKVFKSNKIDFAYILDIDKLNNDFYYLKYSLTNESNTYPQYKDFYRQNLKQKDEQLTLPTVALTTSENLISLSVDNDYNLKANETGYFSKYLTGDFNSNIIYPDGFKIEKGNLNDEIDTIVYTYTNTNMMGSKEYDSYEPYFIQPVDTSLIAPGDIIEYGYTDLENPNETTATFTTTFKPNDKTLRFIRLISKQPMGYYQDKPIIPITYTNETKDGWNSILNGTYNIDRFLPIKTDITITMKDKITHKLNSSYFNTYFQKYGLTKINTIQEINNDLNDQRDLFQGDILHLQYNYLIESYLPKDRELNKYDKQGIIKQQIDYPRAFNLINNNYSIINHEISRGTTTNKNADYVQNYILMDLTDLKDNSFTQDIYYQNKTNNYQINQFVSNYLYTTNGDSSKYQQIDNIYNLNSISLQSIQQLNFNQIIKPEGTINLFTSLINTTPNIINGERKLVIEVNAEYSSDLQKQSFDGNFIIKDNEDNEYVIENFNYKYPDQLPSYLSTIEVEKDTKEKVKLIINVKDLPGNSILTVQDLKVKTNNNAPGDIYTISSKLMNGETEVLKSNVTKTEVDAEYDTLFITGADNISFGQLKLPMKDAENKTIDMINKPWTLSLTDKRITKTDYAIYVQQTEAFKDVNNNQIDPYNISLGVLNNSNQDLIINDQAQMLQSYINPTNTYQTLSYTAPQGFYLNFKNINQVKPSDYTGEVLFTLSFDAI